MCERPRLIDRKWFTGCGRCLFCRIQRRTVWSMRMLHHQVKYPDSAFITLTYDSEHLPVRGSDIRGILVKDDLQRFFKRLRVNLIRSDQLEPGQKITYYACGEYGEDKERPHFHAIVFGSKSVEVKSVIQDAWNLGRVDVSCVVPESIRYVAGYVAKKLGDFAYDRTRPAPFQISSQGLGVEWLLGNQLRVLYDAAISFKGKSFNIPRYYREKLLDNGFLPGVEGMLERVYEAKTLALTDSILELCPQFGGRTFAQLLDSEREEVAKEMAHRGEIINRDLASNAHIKLLGKLAKERRKVL